MRRQNERAAEHDPYGIAITPIDNLRLPNLAVADSGGDRAGAHSVASRECEGSPQVPQNGVTLMGSITQHRAGHGE